MSYSSGCERAQPLFLSPVANFANHMLTGDQSKGEFGLLIRTVDYFDFSAQGIKEAILKHNHIPPDPIPPVRYFPSSYLHASIRAPGAIYQNVHEKDPNEGDYALLFGTKFSRNTIFKEFQTKELSCEYIYMHDAGTVDRGTVFDKSMCNDASKDANICLGEDNCLAHGPGGCGGCKVKPEEVGSLVGQWAEENRQLHDFYASSCYYETIEDAIAGSNSLWKERWRWFAQVEDSSAYQGYTECATSLSIVDKGMADAVVLTLHRTEDPLPQTICNFPNHAFLEQRLQNAFEKGHGDLPVLFYRESFGIRSVEECVRLFDGDACDDAWYKEFFSQEYQFDSGACLHKPPNCEEVYYFPANEDEKCSAFSDKGKSRIDKLCWGREKRHDARVAYETILKATKRTSLVKATNKITGSNKTSIRSAVPVLAEPPSEETILNATAASSLLDEGTPEFIKKAKSTAGTSNLVAGPAYTSTNFVFFVVGLTLSLLLQRRRKFSIKVDIETTHLDFYEGRPSCL